MLSHILGAHPLLAQVPAVAEDFSADSAFWTRVVLLFALVLVSGFFSSAEIALFRISKAKRKHLGEGEKRAAQMVHRLMSRPNRVLITILLGNNLVNIGAAALATDLAMDMFGDAGIGIATGVMTFLVLVIGEITPKAYAARHSQRVALLVSPGLFLVQTVTFPAVWLLERLTDLIFKMFGVKRDQETTFESADELRTMIDVGTEEGVLEEDEQEMIHGVISFGELMAKEVMVPRTDMICLPQEASVEEALKVSVESGYSRLPVYEGNKDNVIGILYAKDLLARIQREESAMDDAIAPLVRECVYVPESKPLDEILTELQEKRVHMAIVVDEYGGTSGIVTMEDLLEEIVGEIFDEYDLRRESIIQVDEKTAIVDARVHVDDVNETLGTDIPEDEAFETMGGFVHHTLGRLAQEGEEFERHGLRIKIQKVTNRRILKIRLIKTSDDDSMPEPITGQRSSG